MAEKGFAADGNGIQRSAVKRVPHRDGLVPACGCASQFHGHAHCGGAAGAEQHFLQIARGQLSELAGQLNRHAVGVAPGAKGQLVELLFYCGNHERIGKSDLMHVVAVKVHVAAALQIFDINACAAAHGVKTWG